MQTIKAAEQINASGKCVITSTTPNADKFFPNKNAPKLSIEYAKGRAAIGEDFKQNLTFNVALAKRIKRQSKEVLINFLDGKVSKKQTDASKKGYTMIVTFPDGSVANL